MVSNPPIEVNYVPERGRGLVVLTSVGNNHVKAINNAGPGDTDYLLDEWALRQLSKQAEAAADALAEDTDE